MAIGPDDFAYLRRLVYDVSGIVLGEEKEYLVEARLAPIVAERQLGSLHDLVGKLREYNAPVGLIAEVVEAMATHETYFFREKRTFDALRESLMPYLIKSREQSQRLEIWSAACAKGQEPFSLAMLIEDSFPELQNWSVGLTASDFSGSILEQARAGSFSQHEVNRGLPAALLPRYFTRDGLQWQIAERIRNRVRFEQMNLRGRWNPTLPRMDLILICNVLIYFDQDVRKQVLAQARDQLKPDGLLVLGAAESSLSDDLGFQRVELAPFKACFQRDDAPGGPSDRS